MTSAPCRLLLPAAMAALLLAAPAQAQVFRSLVVDYETGPVRVFRNDGRYGANGTLYTAGVRGDLIALFAD